MDNKIFNDCLVQLALDRMVSQGYAHTASDALIWLEQRRAEPIFEPTKNTFAEWGSAKTLGRLCTHAYRILAIRRAGYEAEMQKGVKIYYTPRFEKELSHA